MLFEWLLKLRSSEIRNRIKMITRNSEKESLLLRLQNDTVHIMDLDELNLVKFCYGGLILGSSLFSLLPQLPQKMTIAFKVDKIDLKIIFLLCYSKSAVSKMRPAGRVLPAIGTCAARELPHNLKKCKFVIKLLECFQHFKINCSSN